MGKPVVFSGDRTKNLKDGFSLNDKAYVLTGTVDPRVTATDAPSGSLFLRQNPSGSGQQFSKLDSGSTTNWRLLTSTEEINRPFFLTPQATPSLTALIAPSARSSSDGSGLTTAPLANLLNPVIANQIQLPTLGSGIVGFLNGANLQLNLTANQFQKIGIAMSPGGTALATKGTAAASLAAAGAPPVPKGYLAVGYVIAETNGTNNIQNLTYARIVNYLTQPERFTPSETNASFENFRDQLNSSTYQLMTAYVPGIHTDTKLNTFTPNPDFSGYDPITETIRFTASGQTFTTTNLIDAQFITQAVDIIDVDLSVVWNTTLTHPAQSMTIPTTMVYSLSRDGSNYFPVTMTRVGTTGTFNGKLTFGGVSTTEPSYPVVLDTYPVANADSNAVFGTPTLAKTSTAFAVASTQVASAVGLFLFKTESSGVLSGNVIVTIQTDNAGVPSGTVLATMTPFDVTTAGTGNLFTYQPLILPVVLTAGTYHLVYETDAAYKASYLLGVRDMRLRTDASAPTPPLSYTDTLGNGTWVTTAYRVIYAVAGRNLSLFTRILSGAGTYPAGIEGLAVFYRPDVYQNGSVGGDGDALLTDNHLGSTTVSRDRSVSGRGPVVRNGAGVLKELAIDSNGLVNQLESNGTSSTTQGYKGRTDGVAVPAGGISERLFVSATTNIGTSNANVTSLLVPAGVWLLSGMCFYNGANGNAWVRCAISSNSASLTGTISGYDQVVGAAASANGVGQAVVPAKYVNISVATTYYLISAFPTSSANVDGSLQAVRIG